MTHGVDVQFEIDVQAAGGKWLSFWRAMKLPFRPHEGDRLQFGGRLWIAEIERVHWCVADEIFVCGLEDDRFNLSGHPEREVVAEMARIGFEPVKDDEGEEGGEGGPKNEAAS